MKFIAYVPEGHYMPAIINWNCSRMSRIRIIIHLGHKYFYFRWRSKYVGGKRFIIEFNDDRT